MVTDCLNTKGTPRVLHYTASHHALEVRAELGKQEWAQVRKDVNAESGGNANGRAMDFILVALTSCTWRETWKYGIRSARCKFTGCLLSQLRRKRQPRKNLPKIYSPVGQNPDCFHDTGHALASLRFSARLHEWEVHVLWTVPAPTLGLLVGIDQVGFNPQEKEFPELVALVRPAFLKNGASRSENVNIDLEKLSSSAQFEGTPNNLSRGHVSYSEVEQVIKACEAPVIPSFLAFPSMTSTSSKGTGGASSTSQSTDPQQPLIPSLSNFYPITPSTRTIRTRRSALDFSPHESVISRTRLYFILRHFIPSYRHIPLWDFTFPHLPIHLFLFVHRVKGMPPGLYLLPDSAAFPALRAQIERNAGNHSFAWTYVKEADAYFRDGENENSENPRLWFLGEADVRGVAAQLSCFQALAGNGTFTVSMVADLGALVEGRDASGADDRLLPDRANARKLLYKEAFWRCG